MRYYSAGDEAAFFEWLQSIPGVKSVRGIGRELHVTLRSSRISRESLREFVALYTRYKGNMSELAMFANPTNADWFSVPSAPWYKKIFPDGAVGR